MVIGIDYTDEYTQISYAVGDMRNPESVSISLGEKKYLIPTIVSKDTASGRWVTGDKALELISQGEVCFFKNLFSKALWDESEIFDEVEYTYIDALCVFLKSIIESAKNAAGSEDITRIVITLEKVSKSSVELMREVMSTIGYEDSTVDVISHSESFAYYVLKQPRDLRNSDVVVFDFGPSGFIYRRMKISSGKPNVISVLEEDLSEKMNLQTSDDLLLQEIAEKRFVNGNISVVFLNGIGFTGDWMGKSLEYICQDRRAFRGQNLFSKGACYGAMHNNLKDENEFVYLCDGRNKCDISIVIDENGRNRQLVLLRAGTIWYEAGAKIECLLDESRNLQFIISSPMEKVNKSITMDLNSFPFRPAKTTRVEITITYKTEDELTILVKDLGFGEFFKSSEKVVEREIKIKDFL